MGTLGKALGTFGAFVAGGDDLIETLIQRARSYIYTTALPPAVAEATRVSLALARREPWRREHLRDLVARFRRGASELGLALMPSDTPIQPLVLGSAERALAWSRSAGGQWHPGHRHQPADGPGGLGAAADHLLRRPQRGRCG